MVQQKVLELLQEAGRSDCSMKRRNEIQCLLGENIAVMGKDGLVAGLFNFLFVQTIENRPELLPSLFPFFATICGDRKENMIIVEPEWLFMP